MSSMNDKTPKISCIPPTHPVHLLARIAKIVWKEVYDWTVYPGHHTKTFWRKTPVMWSKIKIECVPLALSYFTSYGRGWSAFIVT